MNFFEKYKAWIIIAFVVVVGGVLAIILIPKYDGPGENCVFIGEAANLHNEYVITVKNVEEKDEISILLNKEDIETHQLYTTDTHFIAVTILIKRANTNNPNENHTFDINDFKLKDHTGVKLKNIYFGSVKDGHALSQSPFDTITAIEDYHYINQSVLPGEEKEFVIYFEISDEISVFNSIMILETDLFTGGGDKKGTDIVLAQRNDG